MDNNADNAFPDLLSAALSESGLTDDLEDFSQYYAPAEEAQAQPAAHLEPFRVHQPVQPTQNAYQTSTSTPYIQQPRQQSTPIAVQRHPVVRQNIVSVNQGSTQSPQQNVVRLASPGTHVNIGGRTVKLVSANSVAGNPSNVRRFIIKTVPAGSTNPRQGQIVTSVSTGNYVNTGNVARVLQATTASAQPRIVQNTLSTAPIIQTVPGNQTGQRIRLASPGQGNVVYSAPGQNATGGPRIGLNINTPGIKVIRLATSKGATPQGNVITLPTNIRPGVPVRIVPVRAGPGGLTTGPSQIVTSLSSMGTGPSSIVATAKQQGSNVRVVSVHPPKTSQGTSQPPPVIAQAQGAVSSAGVHPAVTSAPGVVRVTLSKPPGSVNPIFPPGSILTLPSKTMLNTPVRATAPQPIPSVTRQTPTTTNTAVHTVRVMPKESVNSTVNISSSVTTLPSVVPATRSIKPLSLAKTDSFQQSFIEHIQHQQTTQLAPIQKLPANTGLPVKYDIDQDMSDYEIGSGDSSKPLISVHNIHDIVQAEVPELKPEIKTEPKLNIEELTDVKNELIKMEPMDVKSEPKEEMSVMVQQELSTQQEIKTEQIAEFKKEILKEEKDFISSVKQEVDIPKQESDTGNKEAETKVNEEESTGNIGFGLFGDDDASDPFFQALQQLQETNIKAAEFEKQTKSHQAETTKATSTETIRGPPVAVTTSQARGGTPTLTSYSQSSLEGISPSSTGRNSPMFSLGEPFMERSQSPISILRERSSSPLIVQRVGSPSGQGFILPRVGSPSPFTQGQLSLNGSQSSLGLQTQKKVTVTKILPGGIIQTSQVTLPATTAASSTVLPAGTTFTVGPEGIIKSSSTSNILGNRMVIGSSPALSNLTQTSKILMGTPGSNGTVKKELSEKDVSRLWSNEDIKLKKVKEMAQPTYVSPGSPVPFLSQPAILEEEAEDEEEELGQAETYAEYMPAKLKIGQKHPDPVVETSSLSSVEPQDVHYKVGIPENTIDCGNISALQLEAVVYSCQKHETHLPSGERAGFLIGDGAGVGKGRTIAGIIFENYLQGRKRALWLSVSNDLRVDAERDLRDIGASKIDVHPLNKFKYAKISSKINGSVKKGVIFATYSSLIGESHSGGKYRTRLKQLTHWLDRDFDGVIVFDECHRAKNLCPVGSSKPTKTGMTVLELQNRLPKARIVYASATGASEPRHMAYMTRLGLWGKGTPFKEFSDFIQAVEKRGVGAMELVAMDMKLRGMYIARQLSFKGVAFKVEEIPIAKDFVQVYNESVKLWVDARDKFQRAAELIDAEQRMKKTMWGQFWSAHQRFFKYLCISAKVRHCVRLARDAVKNGKCVVIGLQSTGEARTLEQLEESGGELNDFVSTAKGVIQTLVEKHFPAPDRSKTAGLFGLGSSIFDSPMPSPKYNTGNKRKKDQSNTNLFKKAKNDFSDDSGDDSGDSSDSDKCAKKSSSESELSLSESEESEQDSADDNFNPFGNGSDSDEDPWLKKAKKSKPSKKEKKKKEKQKEKKKQKKEKKEKKKKKEKKQSKKDSDDSDDEFDDIDKKFDEALAAAGLKGEGRDTSHSRDSTPFSSMMKSTAELGKDDIEQAVNMKRELLERIERLGDKFPPNTLDELIDALGGTDNVAEMTGRKGRVVSTDDGVQYESRSEMDIPLEILNLTEKQRFMDGEKLIAIISEAASSGISLQADRRVVNQRRRVHITLELPWSADRAIQQFGRTHRSNQVSAPEYVFLISELAGERRFASTVAKRLESLGALTHGDRRATESRDLSRFNIDNKYGRTALEAVMKSVLQFEPPLVPPPNTYQGNFFADVKVALIGVGMVNCDERMGFPTLDKDYNNISKFLNRILGTAVELQNHLFKYFTNTLAAIILQAKRNGRWDMGILDLGSAGDTVKVLEACSFHGTFSGSQTRVTLNTISVERGMTWMEAMEMWREHDGSEDGFYISTQMRNNKCPAILAVAMSGKRMGKERVYSVYRPNTGRQARAEPLSEIKMKYKKVYPDDARYHWEDQYDSSTSICSHAFWKGSCKRATLGLSCETGLRSRTYYVLSGSVLSVWNKVESVLASVPGGHISRMQIIRLRTGDGKRIVGTLIPANAVQAMKSMLSQDTSNTPSPAFHSTLPSRGIPALHHSASAPLMHQLTSPMMQTNIRQRVISPAVQSNLRQLVNAPTVQSNLRQLVKGPMMQSNLRQTMNGPTVQSNLGQMVNAPMAQSDLRQVVTKTMVKPNIGQRMPMPVVQPVAPNPASQFVVNPRLLGYTPPGPQTDSVKPAEAAASQAPTNEKPAPQQYLSMPMFL